MQGVVERRTVASVWTVFIPLSLRLCLFLWGSAATLVFRTEKEPKQQI